jgi:hypothetical protein
MPCRVSFCCPCCGQETSSEYGLAHAVQKMSDAFQQLQRHHKGMDEKLERSEKMRESAEHANTVSQVKVKDAVMQRDSLRREVADLTAKLEKLHKENRDEWLASFNDDELLDEIAERRMA